MVTGVDDHPHPIPELLTGRIRSQPKLQRQESVHDTTMDTTLTVAENVTHVFNKHSILSMTSR